MANDKNIFISATFLGLLGFISLNIYLPALPTIVKDFHTTNEIVKESITLFLIGFSISQFFWGSLSSKHGRKKAIYFGLFFADLGTLLACFAPNVEVFNFARFFEGMGIGCVSVLCRALLTDSFDKNKLSRAMSHISSLANVMPAIAPLVGAYLILFLSWRAIFGFLFLYTTLLMWVFYRYIEETNSNINSELTVKEAITEYKTVFTTRKFVGYILPYLVLSGGMIAYYTASPFIFITTLHISPQKYPYLTLFTVASYVFGAHSSGYFREKFGFNKSILIGTFFGVLPGILFFLSSSFFSFSVISVVIPMMVYTFAAGLVAPNANGCALGELKHVAGAASAVIGASVYAVSAGCNIFINSLDLDKLNSLGIYTIITGLISLISFYFIIFRNPN